jgi:cation diffusion facilitator CzcD-associated flavoprotein CzcO
MAAPVKKILVIGAGLAGMAACIELRKQDIDEIEIAGGDKEEHAKIMRETLMALAGPR